MYKTITVGDKEMELTANAATPFRYKQFFKRDLLQILGNEQKAETEGVEAITELAFIMNKQAQRANLNAISYEDFLTWLEDYSAMAFVEAAEDILNVYMDQTVGTATP